MKSLENASRFCRSTAITTIFATAIAAAPALAQDAPPAADDASQGGLEEIIVTAQRREENLQEVPIAVSAVTASALESAGVGGTTALPQIVPSVQLGRSGPSGLFFIRGVGTSNANVGEEGSNAFYVDGVYFADQTQTVTNFNNIARIEVLKGPQGTLFGRNASGGLIHIITRDPGDELVVKGQATYANYDTYGGQFYVGGPVSDKVGLDLALTGTKQNDGWGRNLTRNTDNMLGWYWGARSKLVMKPSDTVKLTLAADYNKSSDNWTLGWRLDDSAIGSGGTRSPGGRDTRANDRENTAQRTWGASLTAEVDLDFAKLTSVSAYRKNRNHSFLDADGAQVALIGFEYVAHNQSIQQELRLASEAGGPFSWQLGAFYLKTKVDVFQAQRGLAFAPLAGQNVFAELTTNSYAAFAEASYDITPTTHLTGGIRYTKDKRSLDAGVTNVLAGGVIGTTAFPTITKLSYGEFTYRVALRQDLSDDINVYASINRGFKAGTYGLQSPLNPPVRPQFITAYEVGLKSELFDRKLRLNLSAYHYDISNLQVRSSAGPTASTSILLNAADVKVDGLDLEFEAAPTPQLRLFGGATILNSRYGQFLNAPFVYDNPAVCDAPGTATPGHSTGPATGGLKTCFGDASGNRTGLAPKFAASFGGTYTIPLADHSEINLSALYSYNSGYVFEPDVRYRQGSYSLLNASVEYRISDKLGVELWGKNITKTDYYVQKLGTGTGALATLAAPRTYGVSLKFDY